MWGTPFKKGTRFYNSFGLKLERCNHKKHDVRLGGNYNGRAGFFNKSRRKGQIPRPLAEAIFAQASAALELLEGPKTEERDRLSFLVKRANEALQKTVARMKAEIARHLRQRIERGLDPEQPTTEDGEPAEVTNKKKALVKPDATDSLQAPARKKTRGTLRAHRDHRSRGPGGQGY